MIQLVNNGLVVSTYLKTLPVYFVHAEINKVRLEWVHQIFQQLKIHPLFQNYQSLFENWEARFDKLKAGVGMVGKGLFRLKEGNAALNGVRVIGYTDLEFFVALQKWLKYHKIHKYSYFFANITYNDFATLDEKTIDVLDTKVGLLPITTGARGTILRRMQDELHHRTEKLQAFNNIPFNNEENVQTCLLYLKKVLHTPIKKQSGLPALLENVITKVIEAILHGQDEALLNSNRELAKRVLQSAYSCYFFLPSQKSKFNNLRFHLIGITEKSNGPQNLGSSTENITPPDQLPENPSNQSTENTRLAPEDQILLENLRRIEIELMKMMEE